MFRRVDRLKAKMFKISITLKHHWLLHIVLLQGNIIIYILDKSSRLSTMAKYPEGRSRPYNYKNIMSRLENMMRVYRL